MEISIFGFNKYRQIVFNLMKLNMSPTFKQFFQAKTENTDKNKSYYQQYDIKIMRALHKQAMTKQKIYENILARQSGVYYNPGMLLKTSLVNMNKAKALTKNNQQQKTNQRQGRRCCCGYTKHLQITSNDFPVGISYQRPKIGLGNGTISIQYK